MKKQLLNVCLTALVCLMSTAVWAIDKVGDVYQIGSAEDLRAFAELVNGGENLACAVLTADIKCAPDQPMIGTDGNRYAGVFDGQTHTITLDAYPTEDACAVFRYVDYKGMVKNLVVDGQITTANKYAAGIAAYNRGTVISCVSKVTINSSISGDGTHGGIVGIQYMGGVMKDCLSMAKITGDATTNCGGLIGWMDGRSIVMDNISITEIAIAVDPENTRSVARNGDNIRVGKNFYVTREKETSDAEGIQVTWDQLKSGAVCFALNSDQSNIVWTQTLGEDDYPVPFKTRKQVFASQAGTCEGVVPEGTTFNNTSGAECQKHTLVAGKCTNTFFDEEEGEEYGCYYWNPFFVERDAERYLVLKTAQDMEWYAKYHELGGEYASSRLYADIDYTGHSRWLNSSWFSGEFDGMGHTIEIAFPDDGGTDNALFYNVAGCRIHDLVVKGTIETSNKFAAGLVGHTQGGADYTSYISNVLTDVTITSTLGGDGTHGGILGVSDGIVFIDNSVAVGNTVSEVTTCCGGLIGWTNQPSHVTNCAFLGELQVVDEGCDVITRNNGSSVVSNTYYLYDPQPNTTIPGAAIQTTADAVASGELAYLMNGDQSAIGIWQTIGTDAYPMPVKNNSKQVYASPSGGFRCDGQPMGNVTYTNNETAAVIPPHTFNGAFCDVCGFFNADYLQPNADGYYELADGKDLVWFAQKVNSGTTDAKGLLKADIYMEDEDNERFNPIGNPSMLYNGTFNGQFHTIHNLQVIRPDQYTGLFGCVTGGVTIKNLVLAEDCVISGGAFTGMIGGSNGSGTLTMECLGNEGSVTSSAQNAGGIYGCNMSSAATPHIYKCYTTGPVKGANESGQISGWAASGEVKDCWSISELEGVDGENWMFRGSPGTDNNYSSLGQGTMISEEDLQSGALTWKLNKEKFANVVWYQNVGEDEHPVLYPDHGVVYSFGGELGCVIGGDINGLRTAMVNAENDWIQNPDMYAQKTLKDAYEEQIQGLMDANSLESLMTLYEALLESKATVQACVDAYAKYKSKVDETLRYMAEHADFEGPDREFLQDYLESGDEPNEDYPNGGAEYILEQQLLSKEEIEAETQRVDDLLTEAIKNGYVPGTEVTQFLKNADFRDGFNNWSGVTGTGIGGPYDFGDGKSYWGGESWSAKAMDMHQTVTLPKSGYYLLMMNGAYRPANDRYTYSHGATMYANGNGVFLPTVIECYQPIETAEDQVNCNLHSGDVEDLALYQNPEEELEEEIYGYALHGQRSMAIAVMAGRAINYMVAEVGEDGALTVGVQNPHGYYTAEEWTGFANARLVYLGESLDDEHAAEPLAQTLQGDLDRATTILTLYTPSNGTDYARAPFYSEALKTELQGLVNEAAAATAPAAKYELIKKFSDIFNRIYDCRMAYSSMFAKAEAIAEAAETLGPVLGQEDAQKISDAAFAAIDAYEAGKYTAEEARAAMSDIDLVPEKVDGVYQLANVAHMVIFSANVNSGETSANAVLLNDIDMAGKLLDDGTPDPEGLLFTPIGNQQNGNLYKGTFDGQGHTLKNLVIDTGMDYTGLFGGVGGGFVAKNFIIDKNSYIGGGAFIAVVGGSNGSGDVTMEQIGMEGRVVGTAQNAGGIYGCNMSSEAHPIIRNCYVTGDIKGANESGQLSGWAAGGDVTGCWAIGNIEGVDGSNYFFRGSPSESNNYSNKGQVNTYSEADAKSGKMTYNLNGGETDNPAWFQKLGEGGDERPRLFGTDIVYLYNNKYTNEKPTIELNSYAYGLSTQSTPDNVTVNYALISNAKAAKINFKKGDEVVYTQELAGAELAQGKHAVTVANSNLPEAGTELTYDIEVISFGVGEAFRIKAPSESGTYSFWRPYSMAINTNPYSINFGDLYVTESAYDNNNKGYISDDKHNAIFAFDAEFNPIAAEDGKYGFTGGLDFSAPGIQVLEGTEAFEPKAVTFSQDGRLFVGLMGGKTNSPIWEANPDNLDEPWTPVFTGGEVDPQSGITWIGEDIQSGMMVDITTSGKGDALKLWTLACGRSTGEALVTDYFAYTYDLGTKKQWDTTPSGQVDVLMNQWTIAPGPVHIAADNNGGLWYVQYRSAPTTEIPALKHINAEGKVDYDKPTDVLPGGGIAVSPDGSYVAIVSGNKHVTVYNVSYVPNPNGLIMPAPKFSVSTVDGDRISALAFDYAGNLYVSSSSSETVNRYVIPSFNNNVTVTPAREGFKVGATGIQEVETQAGKNEIYTIGGVRVQKAQKGVNIINGNKVLVK